MFHEAHDIVIHGSTFNDIRGDLIYNASASGNG